MNPVEQIRVGLWVVCGSDAAAADSGVLVPALPPCAEAS